MKTVIICGSPKKGSCEKISKKLADMLFQKKGTEIETILLREKQLQFCTGCLMCEDQGFCPLEDDMNGIAKYIIDCEYIIFVTPVYFDNVPAMLKNLIDRSNNLTSKLNGKKVYLITVGQADIISWKNCSDFISNYCDILDMQYLGYSSIYARKPEELTDKKINEAMEGFFYNVSNFL